MKNENEIEGQIINIMILGNSNVGKTSFIIKYTENTFQEVYLSTIGIDYKVKKITIKETPYSIFFYDTTGQERFRSLAKNAIKIADGVILIYDITDKSSFESIHDWIKSVKQEKGDNFPLILLGNKIDKEENRKVAKEKGEMLAKEYNIDFFEISNKEGIDLDEACKTFINTIIESDSYNQPKLNTSSLLSQKSEKKNKSCC